MLARLLDPVERDCILGDFAESGETDYQIWCGILGLVLRRQLLAAGRWRDGLALSIVILPLGLLLSIISRSTADQSAVYVWLYANNWDLKLLKNPGFWRVFAGTLWMLFLWFAALSCASWTFGLVISYVSEATAQAKGMFLCMVLLFGASIGAPFYFQQVANYLHRAFGLGPLPDVNGAVFELSFYRVVFPFLVLGAFVVIPALRGLNQGIVKRDVPWLRAVACVAAIITLASMILREPELHIFFAQPFISIRQQNAAWLRATLSMLQFSIYWPIAYLSVNAFRLMLSSTTSRTQ